MSRPKVKKTLTYSQVEDAPYRPTKADVKRWTELLNWVMFEGKCPKWKNIYISPRLRKGYYALCEGEETKRGFRFCNLSILDEYESFPAFYTILVHELCHSAEWAELGTMGHGRFFYSHREMLKNLGVKLKQTH